MCRGRPDLVPHEFLEGAVGAPPDARGGHECGHAHAKAAVQAQHTLRRDDVARHADTVHARGAPHRRHRCAPLPADRCSPHAACKRQCTPSYARACADVMSADCVIYLGAALGCHSQGGFRRSRSIARCTERAGCWKGYKQGPVI